ncbi:MULTISPECIES: hypothetical protein [Mesorhizobium]|uniref:hypothetical protein n=1 Tax=Mesorhizobium TaxID=68287 RepID=UPI0011410EF8|nr:MULTISPECIES: hypothetical protein [Mesorhizobium]
MRYFAEFNRVIRDNIRVAARMLRRLGLNAQVLPHRTSLVIERPRGMSWSDFTSAVGAVLQPRRGSVMLSSESTGNTFICNNRGNRPGRFIRQ